MSQPSEVVLSLVDAVHSIDAMSFVSTRNWPNV